MKKIIEIKEEVKIGNVILEKGDRIQVLKESENIVASGFKSVFEKEDLPRVLLNNPDINLIIEALGVPSYVRETQWDYEILYTTVWKKADEIVRGLRIKGISVGQISYSDTRFYSMISISK